MDSERWPLPRRIAFRFAFAYALLYSYPFLLDAFEVPSLERLTKKLDPGHIVPALSVPLLQLHVTFPTQSTGSGDTGFDYARIGCFLALAMFVAVVWSAVDRRRLGHPVLRDLLRVCIRYLLCFTMLIYGITKLWPVQFPPLYLARLDQRFADASPMGLLWSFMGYSRPYSFFAGAIEVLGAVLLLWRRTTTLGALILSGVLANVLMLNLCYDVPVKQYSIHLLIASILLAAPDLGRLAKVLVQQRPTRPAPLRVVAWPEWLARVRPGAKVVVIAAYGYGAVHASLAGLPNDRPRSPLAGLWVVESVDSPDGGAAPDARWSRAVVVESGSAMKLEHACGGARAWYELQIDDTRSTLRLKRNTEHFEFSFVHADEDHLALEGELGESHVTMHLRREVPRLLSRGFRWVQDEPFNR